MNEDLKLSELSRPDVPPAAAARIRRRALALLARSAGLDESTLLGRLDGLWLRWMEPALVGGFSVVYGVWAIVFVLAR